MKILTINLLGACLMLSMAACDHTGRHTVIKTSDGHNETKIEYYGSTVFSQDGTTISSISPNGSAEYKHNNQHLLVESDHLGNITYQINGGEKEQGLSPREKIFVTNAVRAMVKAGHSSN